AFVWRIGQCNIGCAIPRQPVKVERTKRGAPLTPTLSLKGRGSMNRQAHARDGRAAVDTRCEVEFDLSACGKRCWFRRNAFQLVVCAIHINKEADSDSDVRGERG